MTFVFDVPTETPGGTGGAYHRPMPAATPLVSILVPAFNVEAYLAAALDSALAQDHPAIEVVVVDDGSTDATPTVIDQYRERVVAVRQDNRGLAGARNTALRHAQGDIIGLLDADDVWAVDRTRRCVERLAAEPDLGMVTTDAWLIEGDEPTRRRFYGGWHAVEFVPPNPLDATAQLDAIARHNFVFVGALIRRELFDRHGGFDESLRRAEDYDLWCRFLLGGEQVGLVDEPLAGYRVRPDSLSADPVVQREAHLTVLAKHLTDLRRLGACGRAGDAYDVARLLEGRNQRVRAARAYLLGARDPRLRRAARWKQFGAAVRALGRPQSHNAR